MSLPALWLTVFLEVVLVQRPAVFGGHMMPLKLSVLLVWQLWSRNKHSSEKKPSSVRFCVELIVDISGMFLLSQKSGNGIGAKEDLHTEASEFLGTLRWACLFESDERSVLGKPWGTANELRVFYQNQLIDSNTIWQTDFSNSRGTPGLLYWRLINVVLEHSWTTRMHLAWTSSSVARPVSSIARRKKRNVVIFVVVFVDFCRLVLGTIALLILVFIIEWCWLFCLTLVGLRLMAGTHFKQLEKCKYGVGEVIKTL
jgi:hypothetical protein